MADNPDIKWALDILTPDPDYRPSLLAEYGLIVLTPITLFVGGCLQNNFSSRPPFSGLHKTILMSLLGYVGAYAVTNYYNNSHARRDQLLRHYIMLHPEDFPQPERKKWGEVLQSWQPVR